LARGYSIVRTAEQTEKKHRIISETTDTFVGDQINILLNKGQIDCTVTQLIEED
jgi:exonuclease VII large subunit